MKRTFKRNLFRENRAKIEKTEIYFLKYIKLSNNINKDKIKFERFKLPFTRKVNNIQRVKESSRKRTQNDHDTKITR